MTTVILMEKASSWGCLTVQRFTSLLRWQEAWETQADMVMER